MIFPSFQPTSDFTPAGGSAVRKRISSVVFEFIGYPIWHPSESL